MSLMGNVILDYHDQQVDGENKEPEESKTICFLPGPGFPRDEYMPDSFLFFNWSKIVENPYQVEKK